MNNRLDVEMHTRGIVRSRSAAADLIKRGKVRVNGRAAAKASQEVAPSDAISIEGDAVFVSRAGEKLAHALDAWKISVEGLVAIDIGASTGGFTDCLIRRGAKKVFAIDVGTDQLDAALRSDPRVESHEKTDIRNFSFAALSLPLADIAVADVSFISLDLILPKMRELVRKGGQAIVLVKPQFEVGKEIADRNKGVITDEAEQKGALEKIKRSAEKAGFHVAGETVSPLEGEKGNKEFLLLLD
ncbi:TlyA family RNA methyltransferase [Candidatus Parcubacteria bacterium]|nr:TlyA family RNA methyltransferase [Candidatus Parcubacteria bacterium]